MGFTCSGRSRNNIRDITANFYEYLGVSGFIISIKYNTWEGKYDILMISTYNL